MISAQDFAKTNRLALHFYRTATSDYLGARCCLINGLIFPGHFMAAQAIEKMLKTNILLVLPNENFRKKKLYPSHDLMVLLKKLQEILNNDLSQFEGLCEKLTKTYDTFRYPDSEKQKIFGNDPIGTNVIHEVDELFMVLFECLKIPDHVLCRTGLIWILHGTKIISWKEWATKHNKAYLKRLHIFTKPISWWETDKDKRGPEIGITVK